MTYQIPDCINETEPLRAILPLNALHTPKERDEMDTLGLLPSNRMLSPLSLNGVIPFYAGRKPDANFNASAIN